MQIDIVSAEWRTNKTADVCEKSFGKQRTILRGEPVLVLFSEPVTEMTSEAEVCVRNYIIGRISFER